MLLAVSGGRSAPVKGLVGALAVSFAACVGPMSGSAVEGERPPRLEGYSDQYRLLRPVRAAKLTPFRTADGEVIDLSRFRGMVVLLNFWATWCAPCAYEMPSLDRLAAEMVGAEFAIVPVAIDKTGLATVAAFYRDHGLDHLKIYFDPGQRTAYRDAENPNDAEFALYGLPMTYIIDSEGRVRGYISGAVDWQSDSAKALIRYYTGQIAK